MVFVRDDGTGDTDMVIGARLDPEFRLSPEEEAEIVRDLERFQRDHEYIAELGDELRAAHCGRFVGVYERRIIGIEEEVGALVAKADEAGVPRGKLAIQYLQDKNVVWAL